MAIIRESVNLTAGLGETIYTVPSGKQASLTVSVANAADTYVAVQDSDLASAPVANSAGSFSNNFFNAFTNTVGFRTTGSRGYTIYYYTAESNWAQQGTSYPTNNGHYYQIPLTTAFNYNAAIANFTSNDVDWRPNGAFSTTGSSRTGSNSLTLDGSGGAHINASGLSMQSNSSSYSIYSGLSSSVSQSTITSGHYSGLYSSGWRVNTYVGANLRFGNSTHYIYAPLWQATESPAVIMWDAGDLGTSPTNTSSRAVRFTGITAGHYIQWIQESGNYTLIATSSNASGSGNMALWRLPQAVFGVGGINGLTDSSTCTDITDAKWSSISSSSLYKPFVDGNTSIFYFRDPSSPYPFTYNAATSTWDTTGYPTAIPYPSEIAGLEATLGDAYSFYKYSSTLNDYYIVAGTNKYTLTPNYNLLDANSTLLTSLQNESEKGGLALKAGDKVISYDTLSGGTVVQIYGYEEDA